MDYNEKVLIHALKAFAIEVTRRPSDMAAGYMIEAATTIERLLAERKSK